MLRWPFLIGYLGVLVIWCGVLFVPIWFASGWESYSLALWFPENQNMLLQAWMGYAVLMLFAPLAALTPNKTWHRHLASEGTLTPRMIIASGIAAGTLNMSMIEVGVIFKDITRLTYMITPDQLAPLDAVSRLSGIVLLSIIWANLIGALNQDSKKILFLNYRLLIYLLGTGLILGPVLTSMIAYKSKAILLHKIWAVPGYTAAQMMQISVILWAMGTSVVLLFGLRSYFRFAHRRCLACGYDMQGMPQDSDGMCPECGEQTLEHETNA